MAVPTSEFDWQGLAVKNVFHAHWKTTFTFDFHTPHYQSWSVTKGFYTLSGPLNGAPIGLVGGGSSWRWIPPKSIAADMTFTNSISSIVNTTKNDTSRLKLLKVENVHDLI
jgi:hypothetical protein